MPSELPVIPMSFNEYEVMLHRLGLKQEYWGGTARLSPQMSALTKYTLPIFFTN